MEKVFYTIRETAATGILSEHYLRMLVKQRKIPHIMAGSKVLLNYPLLIDWLDTESKKCGGDVIG